ncbi:hypothetical protein BJ508DRAFT_367722 [Ascobolus immersus RN42]|uniref:Uncharacterized protein n=1 Tax=Ascobolus immersus RN42 TaxID=1160509 RepID=A0A3N4HHJ1_ASCIM|nr:hypothetical protein BJ508DRAFT_367722 [Ascobolus immersus RN42]
MKGDGSAKKQPGAGRGKGKRKRVAEPPLSPRSEEHRKERRALIELLDKRLMEAQIPLIEAFQKEEQERQAKEQQRIRIAAWKEQCTCHLVRKASMDPEFLALYEGAPERSPAALANIILDREYRSFVKEINISGEQAYEFHEAYNTNGREHISLQPESNHLRIVIQHLFPGGMVPDSTNSDVIDTTGCPGNCSKSEDLHITELKRRLLAVNASVERRKEREQKSTQLAQAVKQLLALDKHCNDTAVKNEVVVKEEDESVDELQKSKDFGAMERRRADEVDREVDSGVRIGNEEVLENVVSRARMVKEEVHDGTEAVKEGQAGKGQPEVLLNGTSKRKRASSSVPQPVLVPPTTEPRRSRRLRKN